MRAYRIKQGKCRNTELRIGHGALNSEQGGALLLLFLLTFISPILLRRKFIHWKAFHCAGWRCGVH